MANVPTLYTLGTNKLQATAGLLSSITMIRKGKFTLKANLAFDYRLFCGASARRDGCQLSPPVLLAKGIPF